MSKKTSSNKPSSKRTVKDHELWELHRNSITPLKDKYRHILFPMGERSIKPHHAIQESHVTKYIDHHTLNIDSFRDQQTQNRGHSHRKEIRARKICIEARLDLHGLTRANALDVLQKFVMRAQILGNQWVLIITGKGDDKNPETLRKLLPQWLDQISQVSGYAPAKPKDGGNGAYYVKIRLTL